ncbi:hypothetical protein H6P81_006269 [Aristolochia fimbriata]|uniref:AB hydrolase-1 domain-containing protein n=1 Tax=Aristolochia fimbriata TaxID=158543 RepID=A0AAV7EWU3_ARIFI|nr:hypothetical protein H6P81_006269 [Aristolochia fimbriata]
MAEVDGSRSWREELASLVDTSVTYTGDVLEMETRNMDTFSPATEAFDTVETVEESESLKDQMKGFLKASAELIQELGRGCRDIIEQNIIKEDSIVVKKLAGPWDVVSSRLRFLNEYLPEDRDPVHAWPVVISVFLLALIVLGIGSEHQTPKAMPKKVYIRPPSATRFQLPDGRYVAYEDRGVPADKARFSLVAPHSFLSSRLAGIPGVKASLLEEFGVRLVTYDLPGFGESDPHPRRNLNSSALDMLYITDALGVKDKFWVVGHSGSGMHVWAAVRYIPDRLAGAALFAPMCNPYDSRMTKDERQKIWSEWTLRRKFLYFLSRRFPIFLPYFYRRSFLSGRHNKPEKSLSLLMGKKDRALMEDPSFIDFWEKDVEESIRQGNPKPFVEEAVLQVSYWGFSLADLQVQKNRQGKSLLVWLKSFYSPAEVELAGFHGPIHIWQGMDDHVVSPAMSNFVHRIVPGAAVHWLPDEGHFSYFYLCEECHRNIFLTLFGPPEGPLDWTDEEVVEEYQTTSDEDGNTDGSCLTISED